MATQRVIVRLERQALCGRDEEAELVRLGARLALRLRAVSFRAYRNPSQAFIARLGELCQTNNYSLTMKLKGDDTLFNAEKTV